MDEKHLDVIIALVDGRMDIGEASRKLKKSVRQLYRLKARAKSSGIANLAHGNKGRVPANKISPATWEKVIALVRSKYNGLSYYALQEILAREHGISIGRESLRKKLRAAGINQKKHFSKGA